MSDDGRAFDVISQALATWQSGDTKSAEALFKQGVQAYEREPDGLAFALGRYGAFLIEQGRTDDAIKILERAIDGKTDIPAIWADYVGLIAANHDLDAFQRAIGRMAASVGYRVEAEFLLAHARRADRNGASSFAEALARWVVELASSEDDKDGRWAAIGDLGSILERAGRKSEAAETWRAAFDEGSLDPTTANRLSMHLEGTKDYGASIAVIQQALTRGLPASVEETLRKRLSRCEQKSGKGSGGKIRKGADVSAYSIRLESTLFEPLFQLRLKPSVKDLELVGEIARCLLASKESSTIVDVDLATGAEMRRVEGLPVLGDTWFAPDGHGIGVRRTAAVGQGPTLLRFLGSDGHVNAESSVPDATSEIALGPDSWYVGCRDGLLYAYGFDGKRRWTWETPGSRGSPDNVYFRPCPYYVASRQSFAVVGSMGNIYAVAPNGKTLWHAELPNERQTRWTYTIPFKGLTANVDAYRSLELEQGASPQQIKSAYRRLALATHPDRNPDDPDATAKFRLVQGAYERILTGDGGEVAGGGLSVSIEIIGMGPTASFIAANTEGVLVGSSQGRLYRYDASGKLCEARALGEGRVLGVLRPKGTLAAAWCDGALLFFDHDRIVNGSEVLEWPQGLAMFGEDVVLWRGKQLQVMDATGRLLWSLEFSKNLTRVVTHGDALACAAGVLAGFRRRSV